MGWLIFVAACLLSSVPRINTVIPKPATRSAARLRFVAISPNASRSSPPTRVKSTPNTSLEAFSNPEEVPSGIGKKSSCEVDNPNMAKSEGKSESNDASQSHEVYNQSALPEI
ncbi:hypothetical protein C0J52_18498 [Blattella germanica]|nr:hypothetical protein C0J52_18498 [Blattella germanica]